MEGTDMGKPREDGIWVATVFEAYGEQFYVRPTRYRFEKWFDHWTSVDISVAGKQGAYVFRSLQDDRWGFGTMTSPQKYLSETIGSDTEEFWITVNPTTKIRFNWYASDSEITE